MNGELRFRRAHLAALVVALVAGAGTAVLASAAGPEPKLITLKGSNEKVVTAKASDGGDLVRISGTGPGAITFGGDRQYTSQRTDCEVTGVVMTNAVCSDTDLEAIEVNLGDGRDTLKFYEYTATGIRVTGRGGPRDDQLRGSDVRDDLEGGDGRDDLRGRGGNDHLDGGTDEDNCQGGPGDDRLTNCE